MKNLEEALERYQEHFEKPYPLCISEGLSDEELIDDIKACINSDIPAEEPDYEDGCDY